MQRVCIALADATRARFYTFQQLDSRPGRRTQEVTGRVDLVNLERRGRPDQAARIDRAFPGRRGPTTEDARLHELDRRFAVDIVSELTRLVRSSGCSRLILAATPAMLGVLRKVAGPLLSRGLQVDEVDRDLTRCTAHQVHEYLAARGLLPGDESAAGARPLLEASARG